MISGYAVSEGKLRLLTDLAAEKAAAVWVDLLRPSKEEERAVETALGIEAPTREEMQEIEISSRLYVENDIPYMTALVLSHTDSDDVKISPVTFALAAGRLLTIRYEEPRVFASFVTHAQKAAIGCVSAELVFVGLLEAIIDRLADVLERATADIDRISIDVFEKPTPQPRKSRDFKKLIAEVGRKGDLASKIRESLVSLERLFGFAVLHIAERAPDDPAGRRIEKEVRARLKTLSRDAHSLTEHVSFVSQKISFVLDGTLGMINIEQNAIIKIFSIAAAAFLPPTLIASIYGMNFHAMPELDWRFGYPLAIGLMLLSGLLPLLYFKRKGWL